MGSLRCTDGSSLTVVPVAERDRGGTPYEVTLELRRDGRRFGVVGQRCGHLLAVVADRLAAARADGSPEALRWPDPDDRFPVPPAGRSYVVPPQAGHPRGTHTARCPCEGRGAGVPGQPPADPELFSFRYRDRVDLPSTGELRCSVRTSAVWLPGPADPGAPPSSLRGRWRVARRAIVEAWGDDGGGVRAVLTSAELAGFLSGLLAEAERRAGPGPGPAPVRIGRDVTDGPHSRRSGP
ncbi:hypothetical protein SAMN04489712_105318 [Thermomonospora echinospora]|uniref:Uncharacterized protein n=1 Tax=Thermomonospora echinospora TaxID=1992 RepID=A0A1H6ACC9_9ACTN|nr:hypothetical protein [Thermomonospora echinospora]SEG45695.1 hypothetical protein SAMN04489712_105318 [Thermomonospora echinospora]